MPGKWLIRAIHYHIIIIEKNIIQAAFVSIELFSGTKGKFMAWTESIEHAAQILGQNTICIAFSKLIGTLLSAANRLKTRSSSLTWTELK